jgi:hypothetical protein
MLGLAVEASQRRERCQVRSYSASLFKAWDQLDAAGFPGGGGICGNSGIGGINSRLEDAWCGIGGITAATGSV